MKAIVFHRNGPEMMVRPSRIIPRLGITSTVKHLVGSNIRTVTVGENGLYKTVTTAENTTRSEKIPWSRLTAWHLRILGVKEIQVKMSCDMATVVRGLTRAKDVHAFEESHESAEDDVLAVDLSTEEGKEEYIHHPVATSGKILTIVNDRRVNREVVEIGLRRLDALGEFLTKNEETDLSLLSGRALGVLTSYTKNQKMLIWILKHIQNAPSITKRAFLALRKLNPETYLSDLDADVINVNFSSLERGDFIYLAEHMQEVRQRLIDRRLETLLSDQMRFFKTNAYKELLSLGVEIKIEELNDLTLAVIVGDLKPEYYPYVAQRMKDALLRLVEGEEIGERYIDALVTMGKDKEPDIARAISVFAEFRAIRISEEKEARMQRLMEASRSSGDGNGDDDGDDYDPKYTSARPPGSFGY
jgi:hypothetical protein